MNNRYRVGVIGFAHMHIHALINSFSQLPNVDWVACADTVPVVEPLAERAPNRKAIVKWAHEDLGIPKVYEDYREMLEKDAFDIILFCPENARHGEVAEAIAAKGIHMITEKPMSASLADALRMVRAVQANNVKLMVNWPTTWRPYIRKVKALIEEGVIGDVWEVKYRNEASMGPMSYTRPGEAPYSGAEKGSEWWHQAAPGGGALLDYCCYAACLARWYIGKPAVAAMAMKANINSHYGDADDNAAIMVRFPKAMAILEGTWTTWHPGVPTGPIVYGTQGTMVGDRGLVKVYTTRGAEEPDLVVEGEPLPEGRTTLAEEFIHHLETGEALHPTLDMMQNVEAMAILDAGIRSAASGKQELVNTSTWCIG